MVDWQAIKVEYITDPDASYRKLAVKYGVSYVQIGNVGRDEKWVELRKQHLNKTFTKTVAAVESAKVRRAKKIQSVADKMLTKIEAIVDRPGTLLPKDVRSLVAAVKDLKEIQGVRSELDEQEQRARIANLEKAAEKDSEQNGPALIIEGLPEEFKA